MSKWQPADSISAVDLDYDAHTRILLKGILQNCRIGANARIFE